VEVTAMARSKGQGARPKHVDKVEKVGNGWLCFSLWKIRGMEAIQSFCNKNL